MSLIKELEARSNSSCELCGATENLSIYEVPDAPEPGVEGAVLLCATCLEQIENPEAIDPNHWRCLNDCMWNTTAAVQVMAWRMLYRLRGEGWPQDLLDMMYMDEETKAWAQAEAMASETSEQIVHRDVNGAVLEAGDNVVLIKDLKVKGSSMVAKQGTTVRRISLDHDNAEYIEGKVDGQQIVILTKYVKKS